MVDIFKDELNVSTEENVPNIDRKEFIKVVESRRSVRVYKKEQIPEKDVYRCLELALLAANSSNLQAWEFYWVKSPEKKKKLIQKTFYIWEMIIQTLMFLK